MSMCLLDYKFLQQCLSEKILFAINQQGVGNTIQHKIIVDKKLWSVESYAHGDERVVITVDGIELQQFDATNGWKLVTKY